MDIYIAKDGSVWGFRNGRLTKYRKIVVSWPRRNGKVLLAKALEGMEILDEETK